jgi:hypothetical protein
MGDFGSFSNDGGAWTSALSIHHARHRDRVKSQTSVSMVGGKAHLDQGRPRLEILGAPPLCERQGDGAASLVHAGGAAPRVHDVQQFFHLEHLVDRPLRALLRLGFGRIVASEQRHRFP